ncbi:MAG: L,D-transpeptidase family protein [Anaerolineae bacterium]
MASNVAVHRRRSSRGFWLIPIVSALMVVMTTGAALAVSPALPIKARPASPTSPVIPWSPARIAKPTYTPSPVPTFTPTPPPTDTPTPEPLIEDVQPTLAADTQDSTLSISYPQDAAPASQSGKYILVRISEQHLYAYESDQLIYSFGASMGIRNSTATGTFKILDKIPNAYGSNWNIWMPNWMGIYYVGSLENGIHALPILPSGDQLWAGFLGTPISFGCVVLGPTEAQQLFDWADVGTPVEIRW